MLLYMQSANSLIDNSNVVPNVLSSNVLSSPDSKNLGDNIQSIRNLKFKDRFYIDNRMDSQMKNADGLSLGANNKFLKSRDYDRQIDANYLRRQDPRNKKYTQPDDFYNGSELAYFEIPKTIPRAVIPDPLATGAIDATNKYQYKNRFISNTSLDPKPNKPTKPTKANDVAMDNILKQTEKDKQQSILEKEIINAQKPPNFNLDKGKNKYNKPTIRTTIKHYSN